MTTIILISLTLGAAPVHVTVDDQNGNPIAPAKLQWIGLTDQVAMTTDSTGFNFTANYIAVGNPPLYLIVRMLDDFNTWRQYTVNFVDPVSSLQATSP